MMNDNEIIKALECCANGVCAECPKVNSPVSVLMCQGNLIGEALEFINRQQAEIERLQKENNQFADIGKMYSEIKSEAIKEFAERLKKAKQYSLERHENIVPVAVIDWIVKEMEGEENV